MRFRSYALNLIVTTSLCVALVGGLNMAVDPYHYFGTTMIEGFNSNKPYAIDQHRLAKIELLERVKPRTLVIGNSRLDVGLDPASTAWPNYAQPVFNLAIPGQGVEHTIETLQHALAHHQPETVLWGVDFLDFLIDPDDPQRTLEPVLPSTPLEHLREMAVVSFSIEGLLDTIATLGAQGQDKPPGILPNGFNATGSYAEIVRNEGHAALFRQKNLTYIQRLASHRLAVTPIGRQTSSAMDAFVKMLMTLANSGVQVKLITYPYHADILEIIHLAGLQRTLEDWQSWLATTALQINREHPHAQIELWDFIGYSEITTEAVPPAGDRSTNMKWYWESGHFKRELGDHMLEVIYPRPGPDSLKGQNFPTRADYLQQAPGEAQRIQRLFQQLQHPEHDPGS